MLGFCPSRRWTDCRFFFANFQFSLQITKQKNHRFGVLNDTDAVSRGGKERTFFWGLNLIWQSRRAYDGDYNSGKSCKKYGFALARKNGGKCLSWNFLDKVIVSPSRRETIYCTFWTPNVVYLSKNRKNSKKWLQMTLIPSKCELCHVANLSSSRVFECIECSMRLFTEKAW